MSEREAYKLLESIEKIEDEEYIWGKMKEAEWKKKKKMSDKKIINGNDIEYCKDHIDDATKKLQDMLSDIENYMNEIIEKLKDAKDELNNIEDLEND